MIVHLKDVVPAKSVADAASVSKRTVIRNAEKINALVMISGKGYVRRQAIDEAAGGRPLKCGLPRTEEGTVDTSKTISCIAAAKKCGCTASTIWRVTRRFGIGIECYGEVLLTMDMIPAIRDGLGRMNATPDEISEMRRRAVNVRWSRQRAAGNGKSDTGAASCQSRRSRAASQ